MEVIVHEGRQRCQNGLLNEGDLQVFVRHHRFFRPQMDWKDLAGRIGTAIKRRKGGSRSRQKEQPLDRQKKGAGETQKEQLLRQLALYMNRDTNKQIFNLFEAILDRPEGCNYETLSRILRTDIITVSHYCCKLKKLRLIGWEHLRQGLVIRPALTEDYQVNYPVYMPRQDNPGAQCGVESSFMFRELSMGENIWVNVSGEEGIENGGLTNQEIKRKIMKQGENKMVRRTVEGMKYLEKKAERIGKVFEFKYLNQTEELKAQKNRRENNKVMGPSETLDLQIQYWLQDKFPNFKGPDLLLRLINTNFKEYISSIGKRESKRQCTPLKLNRYIRALNYLGKEGGMKENELRPLIIKDEHGETTGIMHKRSLMGILQSLKGFGILEEEDGVYFAAWEPVRRMRVLKEEEMAPTRPHVIEDKKEKKEQKITRKGRKRIHENQSLNEDPVEKIEYKRVPARTYRTEIFSAFIVVTFDRVIKRLYKSGFNRILYVERKKKVSIPAVPQLHVLGLLQSESPVNISYQGGVNDFFVRIDQQIQERGRVEDIGCEVDEQILKFVRRNPAKSEPVLRLKYGKNWVIKFEELRRHGHVQLSPEGMTVASPHFMI